MTKSTDHSFEEKGEPKRIRTEVLLLTSPNALPLGQTGSQHGARTTTIIIANCDIMFTDINGY